MRIGYGRVSTRDQHPEAQHDFRRLLPEPLAAVLATAAQIVPAGHLAMAAAVQACLDEAVSKTVNLPGTAAAREVYDIYMSAWEAGCKGITVYVDGSRQVQPTAL